MAHGDLKNDNVMKTTDGEIAIIDWGEAVLAPNCESEQDSKFESAKFKDENFFQKCSRRTEEENTGSIVKAAVSLIMVLAIF